jgi:predicted CoA-binding protein
MEKYGERYGGEKPMTQKEAKELTLELWRYLAEHPECFLKQQVPKDLYNRVRNLTANCPLCKLFSRKDCIKCPLDKAGENCKIEKSSWTIWVQSPVRNKKMREAAAERIVEIVSAWEPKEE